MRRPIWFHTLPSLSRRAVAQGLIAAPTMAFARSPDCGSAPQILFVCEAGTVNSAIARELFRARAADAGLDVRVVSRGLHPEDHLTPVVAEKLRNDGVDATREPTISLTTADIATAKIVIAFNAAAENPLLRAARRWNVPSWGVDYTASKAVMDIHIGKLVAELVTRPQAGCAAPPK
ncbi:MAG: hypothetical protein ACK56C_10410 [Alphaproteobacteria bacterium]